MLKIMLLSLALSVPAFAAPTITTCQLPEVSASVEVSFAAPDETNNSVVVTSKLVMNSVEVPMVRSSCFYKDVPGERGFLCAHQDETTRYDVYPRFAKGEDGAYNGAVTKLVLVRWNAEGVPTSFMTEDCR